MFAALSYWRIAMLATLMALAVGSLGAYVRLSDAGLSCPDWPGCYGRIAVPSDAGDILQANRAHPQRPVDRARAWKEMAHRYVAGGLGLVIVGLAGLAWMRRHRPGQQVAVPIALVVLVLLQALLGMWTVTRLLQPAVVLGHLLGGAITVALLWWLTLRQGRLFLGHALLFGTDATRRCRPWVVLAIAIVLAQAGLGGWTSANYAALACPDFPLCQGELLPAVDLRAAFELKELEPGADYQGGALDNDARVTIHVLHRAGAMTTIVYLAILTIVVARNISHAPLVRAVRITLAIGLVQIGLGIANVVLGLPLELAVAHHVVGVLLLLSVVTVYHMLHPPETVL